MVVFYNNLTRRLSNIATMNGNSQVSSFAYTYDNVGNVTQVTSSCPWLTNQYFTESFTYDASDQLVSLLFLCSPKEKKQKEKALAAVEKNPVHYARQLAERRNRRCGRMQSQACVGYAEPRGEKDAKHLNSQHRSTPLPCYGRRIFSFTPHVAFAALQPTIATSDIYYYHTNHLGSTAYVTDQSQNVTQGFLYAPFGEITTEYAPLWQNGTLPKYAFNAKELDEETGMYYYEARYYKPPVFTGRDAHFESYSSMSPYGYCNNNPLKYIDPTGKDGVVIVDDETQTLTIKATYFVHTEGRKGTYYTSKEIKLMNEEINNFLNGNEYSVTEGQYKGYSVKFDLQFKEGRSSCEAESLSEQEKFFGIPIGNSLSKGGQVSYPQLFNPNVRGEVFGGVTDNNKHTVETLL